MGSCVPYVAAPASGALVGHLLQAALEPAHVLLAAQISARDLTLGGRLIGQLALNAIWTPVFFGLYPVMGVTALWIALAIILALDVMVLVTMLRFWPVRRAAAVLLIPYWAWVLYATTLNAALALMNP